MEGAPKECHVRNVRPMQFMYRHSTPTPNKPVQSLYTYGFHRLVSHVTHARSCARSPGSTVNPVRRDPETHMSGATIIHACTWHQLQHARLRGIWVTTPDPMLQLDAVN